MLANRHIFQVKIRTSNLSFLVSGRIMDDKNIDYWANQKPKDKMKQQKNYR